MLENTFLHLPGIGPRRERWLWEHGCLDWHRFLAALEAGEIGRGTFTTLSPIVSQSIAALAAGDAGFFSARLPGRELWRLYPNFARQALFLDIETTGLSAYGDEVTLIGALGGGRLALFINGINLDEFPAYVAQFPLLVTFNGSLFDVPFLRAHFPAARLDQAHLDLRFALASLGYKGGLKVVERRLGLARAAEIQGVDGFEAVRLWHRYRRGDRAALRKLALYNLTDVVNLVDLAQIAVDRLVRRACFPGTSTELEPQRTRPLDAEYLDTWLAGHLA